MVIPAVNGFTLIVTVAVLSLPVTPLGFAVTVTEYSPTLSGVPLITLCSLSYVTPRGN